VRKKTDRKERLPFVRNILLFHSLPILSGRESLSTLEQFRTNELTLQIILEAPEYWPIPNKTSALTFISLSFHSANESSSEDEPWRLRKKKEEERRRISRTEKASKLMSEHKTVCKKKKRRREERREERREKVCLKITIIEKVIERIFFYTKRIQ